MRESVSSQRDDREKTKGQWLVSEMKFHPFGNYLKLIAFLRHLPPHCLYLSARNENRGSLSIFRKFSEMKGTRAVIERVTSDFMMTLDYLTLRMLNMLYYACLRLR